FEHCRFACARRNGDVIEAECERALGIERAAETHATVERKALAALEQQANHFQKVLVPADSDAVFVHPAAAGHTPLAQRLCQRLDVADRSEGSAFAVGSDTRK